MMKLTPALKSWLVQNCGVKSDASDDEFQKAVGDALVSDKMTADQLKDLTKSSVTDEANAFNDRLNQIANSLEKAIQLIASNATKEVETKQETKKEEIKETKDVKPEKKEMSGIAKMFSLSESSEGEDKSVDIRVKEAAEMYSTTKSTMTYPTKTKNGNGHPLAGDVVKDFSGSGGRVLETASDRDKAIVGAWAKFMIQSQRTRSKQLALNSLPDHDKELILYALHNEKWCGNIGDASESYDSNFANVVNRKLHPSEQKALIDDSTSGGIEAVPIPFDDMIVSTPILQGELFPLVNTIPLDRGRRVQGARAGIVTSEWGGIDDTSITLFDTASYVTAFDTTIYRWQGSITIGLDFISDTPIDFGQFLTAQYGEVMLQNMDNVIATGDGTTQPEGIMNKSGTGSVSFGGVTATLSAYESLRFGVHKREHTSALMRTAVFCGTDVSYQRAMAIPVGASDARRLQSTMQLGNYDGYVWMGRPYKINESLSNAQIFYAILGRYRMYRRRGLTIRTSTEGDTLIRKNEMLLVASGRYGGQLERGAAAAVTSTALA